MPPVRLVNAQGRQKSCSQCVTAKRRCDLEHPRCIRCSRLDLCCTYPRKDPSTTSELDGSGSRPSPGDPVLKERLEFGPAVPLLDPETLDYSTALGTQLFDFDMPSVITSSDALGHFVGSIARDEDLIAMARHNDSAKPSIFSFASLAPSTKSRVGYAIDQLKSAPRTMVENNSTLWCHATLYEEHMPRSLQAAHAACALYNATNETNAGFVIRHITSCVDDLVHTNVSVELMEILGRAHAFMLYQTVLVFSGDVQLHSQAEILVPHLEHVGHLLLDLCARQDDPIGILPLYPSTAACAAWKSFVLRETMRRTVLSLFQLVNICHLLRGQPSSCVQDLSLGNKVTLSATLWSAKTAFDFALVWNERPHFLVRELDFTEVLRDAQPNDMDDFAKTMLVGLQGIDNVRGWFYTRGGIF